jgi:hypothetical protein
LEYESIYTQIIYYIHWNAFGNNERISQDEIYEISKLKFDYDECNEKLDKLCKKYKIKWNDWIWDFLASIWQMDVEDLKDELVREPWYFLLDQYKDENYYEWRKEIEKKGYNHSRGEIRDIEAIKKEVEESYIKEGADTEIDGLWVKTKSIYSKDKENKNVINQTLSFKLNHDWDKMDPQKREIYWDEMKRTVNKYKEIRINAARIKKEKKERERRAKEEAAKQKPIIIEKPNIPINKEKPKPIIIKKCETKPIVISNVKSNSIIITKPTDIEKPIPKPIIIQKKEAIQVVKLEKKFLNRLLIRFLN